MLPFECTYGECIKRFATLKEMKYHKINDPDHYYCKKCDLDCEDWDTLTQVSRGDAYEDAVEPELTMVLAQSHSNVAMGGWPDARQT